ncbi:MAG: ABC transporter substrate-binding protein [Acetatifactor sp.]|nr:ABC transporter substrate-binding protein [Acetatifactor sp.]
MRSFLKNSFPFFILISILVCLSGCAGSADTPESDTEKVSSLELKYATEFNVDYFEEDIKLINVNDGNRYLIVPERLKEEADFDEKKLNDRFGEAVIIYGPSENVYLAASSAFDMFVKLLSLDKVKACSTKEKDISIDEFRARCSDGKISYVGKYSAPDYEALLNMNCDLAIESTMIYHAPQIKEQLFTLGIPVVVERSSYEATPLGRLEWIKFYGALFNLEKEAEEYFDSQCQVVEKLEEKLNDLSREKEVKVAFFYISGAGYVNVRKPGDYITCMIKNAGGTYVPDMELSEEDNALSTININWEDFYAGALDADIIIYNGTIDNTVVTLDDLYGKNPLFADFKAVKEGNVWCTDLNMFQETGSVGDVMMDLYRVINNEHEDETVFLRHLE